MNLWQNRYKTINKIQILTKKLADIFEELTIQASSLSFYTIFSIVPIVLIVLSVFSSTPMFSEYYQKIEGFIISNLLPTNQEMVKTYINSFLANSKTMGVVGGVYIFVTSILLLF